MLQMHVPTPIILPKSLASCNVHPADMAIRCHPLLAIAQVVVPAVTSNGLKWTCSGDYVARQCLQYRGVLPVCADASIGRPDGAVLTAALKLVSHRADLFRCTARLLGCCRQFRRLQGVCPLCAHLIFHANCAFLLLISCP